MMYKAHHQSKNDVSTVTGKSHSGPRVEREEEEEEFT
jgi:hypothetical protein